MGAQSGDISKGKFFLFGGIMLLGGFFIGREIQKSKAIKIEQELKMKNFLLGRQLYRASQTRSKRTNKKRK